MAAWRTLIFVAGWYLLSGCAPSPPASQPDPASHDPRMGVERDGGLPMVQPGAPPPHGIEGPAAGQSGLTKPN